MIMVATGVIVMVMMIMVTTGVIVVVMMIMVATWVILVIIMIMVATGVIAVIILVINDECGYCNDHFVFLVDRVIWEATLVGGLG